MDAKLSQCPLKMHLFRAVSLSTLEAIRVIKSKLNPSQQERFKASCFGKLFGISTKVKFSGPIVDHVLSRQVDHWSGGDEMWFDVGGKRARFSRHEFALVTGLNCGNYPPRTELEGKFRNTRLRDKYFEGLNAINTRCLEQTFLGCGDEEDAYRLSLVYFLQALLLSRDPKSSIDRLWLSLADDLECFDEFPWGKVCYERTIWELKKPLRLAKSKETMFEPTPQVFKYNLGSFPLAFMVWAYEAVPLLGSKCAKKKKKKKKAKDLIPRILRWESSWRVQYKNLQRDVFGLKKLDVRKKLRASELESEQDYMKSIGKFTYTLDDNGSDFDVTLTSDNEEQSDVDTDDFSSVSEFQTFTSHIMEVKKKRKKLKHIEEINYEEKRSEVMANISWVIKSKGKRKSRKRRTTSTYVPFPWTDPLTKQKIVSGEAMSLNQTQG